MAERVPRVVLVTRQTDFQALLARHGTREQARFFLEERGQRIEEVEARHRLAEEALRAVSLAIPRAWRRIRIDRSDLSRFVFEPEDLVVAAGQDGLVANVAKYLEGQLVLGVNTDPERYGGVLVRHRPAEAGALLAAAAAGRVEVEERSMVDAALDDGQRLRALNEVFVGHRSHQSARYRLRLRGREERQSSSGLIVATGTGATGWALSINLERGGRVALPKPDDRALALLVREPFPGKGTGTSIGEGLLGDREALEVVSEMNEGGVLFGDGIEEDRIDFAWGLRAQLRLSQVRLRLVRGA